MRGRRGCVGGLVLVADDVVINVDDVDAAVAITVLDDAIDVVGVIVIVVVVGGIVVVVAVVAASSSAASAEINCCNAILALSNKNNQLLLVNCAHTTYTIPGVACVAACKLLRTLSQQLRFSYKVFF